MLKLICLCVFHVCLKVTWHYSFKMNVPIFQNEALHLALRGYCTSYPKIIMFCALSQNYQHPLEK